MTMGYQIKGKIECDGCGQVKQFGYRIEEGPISGIFHSRECFNVKKDEYERKVMAEEAIKSGEE